MRDLRMNSRLLTLHDDHANFAASSFKFVGMNEKFSTLPSETVILHANKGAVHEWDDRADG